MVRFEYLVVYVENDRVLFANGHWQGTVDRHEEGDTASCPGLIDYLSEAGAQGWELVTLDPEETGTAKLYFKRARVG